MCKVERLNVKQPIEPSHLDLCCLQKPIIITCGSERVKPKNWLSSKVKTTKKPKKPKKTTVTKIELSMMPKLHAYLQTMIKEQKSLQSFKSFGIKLYEFRTQGTNRLSSNARTSTQKKNKKKNKKTKKHRSAYFTC